MELYTLQFIKTRWIWLLLNSLAFNVMWNHYLKTIKGPTSELQPAGLLVKRKIPDIDIARGLEYRGRLPLDQSIVIESSLGHCGDVVIPIRAATNTRVRKRDKHTGGEGYFYFYRLFAFLELYLYTKYFQSPCIVYCSAYFLFPQ